MPLVDVICLANSTKLGGRCVAGIKVDGGAWVRPHAPDADFGQLRLGQIRLDDGSIPQVLDVIGMDLAHPKPLPHQPENWLIGTGQWKLRHRPGGQTALHPMVRESVQHGPELLGSVAAKIKAPSRSVASSLALVAPEALEWFLSQDSRGRDQPRAFFDLSGKQYSLPVTDDAWTPLMVRALRKLDEGKAHPQEAIGISRDSMVLFVVSLSEPYNGYCYKLVAGIIVANSETHTLQASGSSK